MSLNSFRHGMGRITETPAGKYILFALGAILIFSLVYSGLGNNLGRGAGAGAAPASGDDVVATVEGQPITRSDYEQEVSNVTQQMGGGQAPSPAEAYQLNNFALQQLISAKLQLAAAKKMGVSVSDQDIKKQRQQEVTQSGLPKELGLPANASIADVDNALSKQGQPSIEERLPDDTVRDALILNKLHDSFTPAVTPTDAQDFYKEYHTQHILISNKTVSDAQAQTQAQQILAKALKPGADFAALAKQYSDDPGTKNKGGDDGWIGEDNNFNNYIPEFVKAVQTLQPGQTTPTPVKTPEFGYFIIKLDGVRENLPKDFAKNQAQYLAQIKQQRQQTAYQTFLTNLKTQSGNGIVVKDPALAGDQALSDAAQATDPTARNAKLHQAIASYQQALKNSGDGSPGDIEAALGSAYQQLAMIPDAIKAYKAAVAATRDQQLEMTLGQLYEQNKDDADAVAQYQAVSQQAWNDPMVHQQLARDFFALKRPDLSAKETALYQQIQKRQQAATPNLPGGLSGMMPPGAPGSASQPVTVSTGAPQKITIKPASGKTTSGKPAKAAHAPAQ